ncbi:MULTISPECIES: sacsin N-terminal ATP-binding-like domain-containing protein [Flavobacterium]|uniref:Uncharacterized protein n=1 Tax=Flavobacterium cutihirudinis TaxID=1265740 RepID=A0A3D9G194_9FLAO|nr:MULTISPECIES: hypothetical protein [Flavobacterium]MBZ4040927.1 hypothetical protein [Flavobacterium hibisci]RED26991.1 hypothetical protein BD847_0922 [Flavobacterium cutihirudinis]
MTDGIFTKFERDELNKITAKSILEKLMSVRQEIQLEFTARRLIWELMQNAKDNASLCNEEGEKVDIKIEINENQFIFSHNKGYFTNEHIRGLIRKYSSSDKERDPDAVGKQYKTTGRFGTGFMTTHLLSEKVLVKSFYKNEEENFNEFSFWLNRSGRGEKEIIEGINQSFDDAEESIKMSETVELTKNDFQTSFVYPLTPEKRELAQIAFDEAEKGIAYTLINVPEINSLTMDLELIGETVFKIVCTNTVSYQNHNVTTYNLLINGINSDKNFIVVDQDELQIIIPISIKEGMTKVLELDYEIPRIHLDFPLIGTEDLHLPFIINSCLFEPTEPRNGISLKGDGNEISKINSEIMLRAVELYKLFLSYVDQAGEWKDLFNLARVRSPKTNSWIDMDWYKPNIVNPIRNELLYARIVDVVSGERIAIWDSYGQKQAFFPSADKEAVREQIWKLSSELFPAFVPIKDNVHQWSTVLWADCQKYTLASLSQEISNNSNIENLASSLNVSEHNAIVFLNEYYQLLNTENIHIKDILTDAFAVIPNQFGEFKVKSLLNVDKEIDDELKNACAIISTDPREYLVHKQAQTGAGILYPPKKQDDIIAEINALMIGNTKDNIVVACDYLASLFSEENKVEKRELIFKFSQRIYPDDFTEKRILKKYDEKIWQESDKKSLSYLAVAIAEHKTIEGAVENLNFRNEGEFIIWLDALVSFLVKEGFENNINREKHPILPNQNGVFCTKDSLFLDEGNIGDELKDIVAELGHDFRNELLDTAIFLELPESRQYNIGHVAEKIAFFIKPIIRDIDKRKEFKTTLKKFYLWMDDNRTEAEEYFADLFEKRFLFLEDDDISSNMKDAAQLNQLLIENGLESIEDLRAKLATIQDNNFTAPTNDFAEKTIITKETLVSLGISTYEELEIALKDPLITAKFHHVSKHTKEMLDYAQNLIARAKQNIISYLQSHPDYDCTDLEETAPTTLAGITKNGVAIQIVTRPSDNGEVIIYYPSEKDTLDSDTSELWVDNDKHDPHILTLGRVLKSTGINRIPINMN